MGTPSQHHEPMIAMICPEKTGEKLGKLYHNQYMGTDGKWTTDFDHKATCRQDKVEILEYCKKVSGGIAAAAGNGIKITLCIFSSKNFL